MRTSVEIPDSLYRELKVCAASEGTTLRELILEGAEMRLKTPKARPTPGSSPRFPAIESSEPGSLRLGEEGVYDFIPFP